MRRDVDVQAALKVIGRCVPLANIHQGELDHGLQITADLTGWDARQSEPLALLESAHQSRHISSPGVKISKLPRG